MFIPVNFGRKLIFFGELDVSFAHKIPSCQQTTFRLATPLSRESNADRQRIRLQATTTPKFTVARRDTSSPLRQGELAVPGPESRFSCTPTESGERHVANTRTAPSPSSPPSLSSSSPPPQLSKETSSSTERSRGMERRYSDGCDATPADTQQRRHRSYASVDRRGQ